MWLTSRTRSRAGPSKTVVVLRIPDKVSKQLIQRRASNSPSETLEARSKTPTTGFVTALLVNGMRAILEGSRMNTPNEALADTFEETKRSFGLGTFDWLHLKQDQLTGMNKTVDHAYKDAFHCTGNTTRECFTPGSNTIALRCGQNTRERKGKVTHMACRGLLRR